MFRAAWAVVLSAGVAAAADPPVTTNSPPAAGPKAGPAPVPVPVPVLVPTAPEPPPGVRQELVPAMVEAFRAETDPKAAALLANWLSPLAGESQVIARELVAALKPADPRSAAAYEAIDGVMLSAPPALVRELIPVLKSADPAYRRKAAVLLLKVSP